MGCCVMAWNRCKLQAVKLALWSIRSECSVMARQSDVDVGGLDMFYLGERVTVEGTCLVIFQDENRKLDGW